jgi:hypothetical protein
MEEETLYYESFEDAVSLAIRKANKTTKEVAQKLWDKDDPHIAHTRLLEALNPRKKQKLSANEIVWIMNYCGRADPLFWFCQETLHERPAKKSVEIESEEILQEIRGHYAKSTKLYQDLLIMLEKRDAVTKLRAVSNEEDKKAEDTKLDNIEAIKKQAG